MEIPEISARRSYYDGLSKGDLRSLVTDGTFDAVHKYDKAPSTTKNNSVLIATANSDGNVLLDGVGNRRQVIVQFPAYDSTEASMAAGAKSADYLRNSPGLTTMLTVCKEPTPSSPAATHLGSAYGSTPLTSTYGFRPRNSQMNLTVWTSCVLS